MKMSKVQISPLHYNNQIIKKIMIIKKICAFKGKEDNYQNANSSINTLTEKQTLGHGNRMLLVSNDTETINFTIKILFMISNNVYSLSTDTNVYTSMGMT